MESLETVAQALHAVRERLDTPALEPDPDARGGAGTLASPREIADEFVQRVVTPFEELRGRVDDEEARDAGGVIAYTGAQVAALLNARGNAADAESLLARLVAFAPEHERPELDAARREIHGFTTLVHARWLMRNGQDKRGRQLARTLAQTATDPQIGQSARETFDAPRPIKSAPALVRINGCGVGLYGKRDPMGDSVVSTHCVSLLFVPVVPLAAYRVVPQGGGSYLFLAKEKLSPFATWWRRFVLASVAVLLVSAGVRSYWNDPDRVAERKIDAARDAQEEGRPAAAVASLEEYLREATAAADVSPDLLEEAGTVLARLYAAELPPPLAPEDADRAVRVVRRFERLPSRARHGSAGEPMVDLVLAWCDSLPGDDAATQQLRVRLLDAVLPLSPIRRRTEVGERRLGCSRALAAALAKEWPIPALESYLDLGDDPQAIEAAGDLLLSLSDDLALLEEARSSAENWLERAGDCAAAVRITDRLAAARRRAGDEERAAVLAAADPAALAKLIDADPRDQEALAVLARHHLETGEADRAAALLAPLAPPGRMTRAARETLAHAWVALDRLPEAGVLLADVLRYRLPRFMRASTEYERGAEALQERLVSKAERGDLPAGLVRQLEGEPVAEQRTIFQKWLAETLEKDELLSALRDEAVSYSDVIPLSLLRGRVALLRARQVEGPERQRFLDEAEQAFLGVSAAAEGLPEYHLGLGQVYHRTGRIGKGDAEFTRLLEDGNAALAIQVAQAYRELGVTGRAREIATRIYEGGDTTWAPQAATLMSLLAHTLEEKRQWLERADSADPFIRTSLLETRAYLAYRARDPQRAAGLIRQAIEQREAGAASSDAAANNVAIACQFLYRCTGEATCLERARAHFETALGLSPDQMIIVSNAADLYRLLGDRALLARYADVDLLRSSATAELLDSLRATEIGEELAGEIGHSRDLRRCAELSRRAIVLAPQAAGGYRMLFRLAREKADLAALRALRDELAALPDGLDTTGAEAGRLFRRVPENQRELLEDVRAMIANDDRALAAADSKDDARTAALARFERSANHGYLAWVEDDHEAADRAVDDARAAAELWPVLRDSAYLAHALLVRATIDVGAGEPALRRAWESGRFERELPMLLLDALRGDDGEAVARALAANPDCREAGAVLARAVGREGRGDFTGWVVGQILGDEALTRASARYFEDEQYRLHAEIYALLDPGDEDARKRLALFE